MQVKKTLGAAATALIVAAAIGLACWFVYSLTTGATLVIFRTGSMSPTIPQGSLAISVPVEAEEIRVGDVVTVKRPDQDLPVTHRVVEIREPGDPALSEPIPPEARSLIMQGDANATVDRLPYVVIEARKVVFSVPHVGHGLMLLQSSLGLGVMTLIAGTLTIWAFWPKKPEPTPVTPDTTPVPTGT